MKDSVISKKKKRRRLKGGVPQKLEEVTEHLPNVDDDVINYERLDDDENDAEELENGLEELQEYSSRNVELEEGLAAEDVEQRRTDLLGVVGVPMKNRPNLNNEVGLKTFRLLEFLSVFCLSS